MNRVAFKKWLSRMASKLAVLCLIYAVGFVSAIYWAVSPGPSAAAAKSDPYPPAAVSISRVMHKSVDCAQAAAEKAGQFVNGDSEDTEKPVQ